MPTTWTAPGRANLIGEHVDYNDGLVLPFALPFATTATATRVDGGSVQVSSKGVGDTQFAVRAEPGTVEDWAAYVAGVVWALRERGVDVPGLQIELSSDVPTGAGLSSSAALCCSVAAAVAGELDAGLDAREVAAVARRAENEFVGAPTGTMDQLASMLSIEGHALLLDCRTLETRNVPIELSGSGLQLLLIDTGASHSLVSSGYGDRRRECELAAQALGVTALRDAVVEQVDAIDDLVLRRRARHVITEIARVREVVDALDAGRPETIGDALSASHVSLSDDFEVSTDELDATVHAAREAGALGARMTGGGFGGCVIALCRAADRGRVVETVNTEYARRGWDAPTVWEATPSRGAHRVH